MSAAGLFTERTPGAWSFPHPAVEDYLADRWLARDPALLSEIAARDDPRWAQPVRLGVEDLARTSAAAVDELLAALPGTGAAAQATALLTGRPCDC